MKKKIWLFQLAYYILIPLLFLFFYYGFAKLFHTSNLGEAIVFAYGLLFIATPCLIAVFMRFSLLKWYVDPLAATEVPLFLYIGMIITRINRSGISFYSAFLTVNNQLSAKGGEGWFVLLGLFLFGLACSLSFARKNEKSISYRLITKFRA